jgi:hypothetical protein
MVVQTLRAIVRNFIPSRHEERKIPHLKNIKCNNGKETIL